MGEPAVGLILAGLDVDTDNGAAWNRWYDLEHLAPNLALPGIVAGKRYVATPSLHDTRLTAAADPAWGSGRGVYLTWYATSIDPGDETNSRPRAVWREPARVWSARVTPSTSLPAPRIPGFVSPMSISCTSDTRGCV